MKNAEMIYNMLYDYMIKQFLQQNREIHLNFDDITFWFWLSNTSRAYCYFRDNKVSYTYSNRTDCIGIINRTINKVDYEKLLTKVQEWLIKRI
jgi:hypothetical protein